MQISITTHNYWLCLTCNQFRSQNRVTSVRSGLGWPGETRNQQDYTELSGLFLLFCNAHPGLGSILVRKGGEGLLGF